MVCYALYNEFDVHEFRWYGKTSKPAEFLYDLPVLKAVSATGVTEV